MPALCIFNFHVFLDYVFGKLEACPTTNSAVSNGGNKFNGFIEEPSGNSNKQARQANTFKSKASQAKPSATLNKRARQSGGPNWLNPQPEPPAPLFRFGSR